MTESPQNNTPPNPDSQEVTVPIIPIEFVSEEEMALIEAAYAASRSSLSSSSSSISSSICSPSRFQSKTKTIQSITLLSKRCLSGSTVLDIEDSGNLTSTQKRSRVAQPFLHRFRRKRGLSVTDITATEWCEKQMEFVLLFGNRKINKAMKAGQARHVKLEEEVVNKVEVCVQSVEDTWAVKFINFITGANQLLFEGLTRELPLIGFVEGVCLVGVIDEIQMPAKGSDRRPILIDTKTRAQDSLPAEPQRRNGRLQLMCYKNLWDTLVADSFPSRQFFNLFSLDPSYILSEDIIEKTTNSGFPAKTLDDVVGYYRNTCNMLPVTHNQLILRYELQKDQSVLGEDQFAYDPDWLKRQIQGSLEFWLGEREASYTPEEERWKCRHCQFASICPGNPFKLEKEH
ncbi:exonuclease V, chloroplastic-like isoform X2 [Durio zibethinus]|uniref:Exonuclease V, chloroplastic-like isoform X2 n=1 Tax=Durio zibethinus TaxID=66656 RepID=A0A6P5ZJ43_DURZI|nr:exonuclease V, chloroplastic-like isoform X2 [Durio zibethinus]